MPGPRYTRQLHRMTDIDGRTLFFVWRAGDRRRRSLFFRPDQAPALRDFERESGWFLMERDGRGGWAVIGETGPPPGSEPGR